MSFSFPLGLGLLLLIDAAYLGYAAAADWVADGVLFWCSFDVALIIGCLSSTRLVRDSQPRRAAPAWILTVWVVSTAIRSAQFTWLCADQEPLELNIVSVPGRAACLDGSPPAYHWRPGKGADRKRAVIFLMGGGWCMTPAECQVRADTDLGTSKGWETKICGTGYDGGGRGFLASHCAITMSQLNPSFTKNCVLTNRPRSEIFPWRNWAVAHVPYCDGGSYVGNGSTSHFRNGSSPLWYRGHANFESVVNDLVQTKGLADFESVILSGCSAGGLGVIYQCDNLANRLPQVDVRCVADAGVFISSDVHFQGLAQFMSPVVPKYCVAALGSDQDATSLCMLPRNVLPHLRTPLFVVNSLYDEVDASYVKTPEEHIQHREKLLRTIAPLRKAPHGVFIAACPRTHCMLHGGVDGWFNVRADGASLPSALADWYFSKIPIDVIDDTPASCESPVLESVLYVLFILRIVLFLSVLVGGLRVLRRWADAPARFNPDDAHVGVQTVSSSHSHTRMAVDVDSGNSESTSDL